MSVTMLGAPETRVERHDSQTEAVVTITVQITLAGDELPAAASRLISDLEALVNPATEEPPATPTLHLVTDAEPAAALYLHTASRLVLRHGEPVRLTRREFDLFQFLCENPRRVFTRAQLLRQVWGYDMVGTERTVDVHIRRLRVKLRECSSIISTVRGVGYRLDDDAPVDIVIQED